MLGFLAKKKGMTQIFDDRGNIIPVTVLEAGPCTVVQVKTEETDGYNSIQIGFEVNPKAKNVNRAMKGHFEKNKVPYLRHVKEFRVDSSMFNPGDTLYANAFQVGDIVDVRGMSKGRGFQGVMKRHGKHGGPATHGSHFHRTPGSIGMRTWPRRVFKNMKLPGHMGCDNVCIKNLEVVSVRDNNIILIKGAVPGAKESIVELKLSKGLLENRENLKNNSVINNCTEETKS